VWLLTSAGNYGLYRFNAVVYIGLITMGVQVIPDADKHK
jgi:hypothetical protein